MKQTMLLSFFAPSVLALLILAFSAIRQRALLCAARQKRYAVLTTQLRTARLLFSRQRVHAEAPRLELELELNKRGEEQRLARLRALLRELETQQKRSVEELTAASSFDAKAKSGTSGWHSVDGDGRCPAEVPQWDWQLLLRAATASDDVARESALEKLASQSHLALGSLGDLAHRYAGVLSNPEFAGILSREHPECGGTRFASLEGDRILRLQCDDPAGASYALDEEGSLHSGQGEAQAGVMP